MVWKIYNESGAYPELLVEVPLNHEAVDVAQNFATVRSLVELELILDLILHLNHAG